MKVYVQVHDLIWCKTTSSHAKGLYLHLDMGKHTLYIRFNTATLKQLLNGISTLM